MNERHGMSNSREHCSWKGMMQRCYNQNNPSYGYYGGRGITVCARWRRSFLNFFKDMGVRPAGMTLDRFPDPAGNYERTNCRWASPIEQARNRRTFASKSRRMPLIGNSAISTPELAAFFGVSVPTLLRWHRRGDAPPRMKSDGGRHFYDRQSVIAWLNRRDREDLSKEQIAEVLGVSTATLLRWHNLRIGPPRVKIGRTIRYPREQAEEYLNAHAT